MMVHPTDRPRRPGARPFLGALILGLGLGVMALPGPANAQFFGGWGGWGNGGWGGDGLPGPEVRRSIMSQGFRVLGPLRRDGNMFVAEVIDRRGRRERLVVAAADAQILQRYYVDDGRGPGAYARGADRSGYGFQGDEADRGGLVPPADIPGAGRRAAAPPQRFGDLGEGSPDGGSAMVPPLPLRHQPPVKTVRPRPRVVERSPDAVKPDRRPAAVEATPLLAPVQRPKLAEPPKGAPATVASKPDAAALPRSEAATPPASSASDAPAAQPRRLKDPLAIPGGPNPAPVRSVSGSVTGAPAAPAPAAKTGDVPAAPLD